VLYCLTLERNYVQLTETENFTYTPLFMIAVIMIYTITWKSIIIFTHN